MNNKHIQDLSNPGEKFVLIYAGDHGLYWAAPGNGYTRAEYAEVYTREEAFHVAGHCGPERLIGFHNVPAEHIPTLLNEVGKLASERDSVRNELADLAGQVEFERKRAEAAESQVAGLRMALELVRFLLIGDKECDHMKTIRNDGAHGYNISNAVLNIDDALAATPAQHAARIKARVLKSAIDTFPNIEGGELHETSFMAWMLRLIDEAEKEVGK